MKKRRQCRVLMVIRATLLPAPHFQGLPPLSRPPFGSSPSSQGSPLISVQLMPGPGSALLEAGSDLQPPDGQLRVDTDILKASHLKQPFVGSSPLPPLHSERPLGAPCRSTKPCHSHSLPRAPLRLLLGALLRVPPLLRPGPLPGLSPAQTSARPGLHSFLRDSIQPFWFCFSSIS